jgi:transposase InsO family protein
VRNCAGFAGGWPELELEGLVAEIRAIHGERQGRYGSPRMHDELRRRGRQVNRKRVERLMRERGIVGATRRRRRSLTKPDAAATPRRT